MRALANRPDYVEAVVGLADCLKGIGETDEAIELYQRAIGSNPECQEALNDLGVIYLDRDNFEDAQRYFLGAANVGSLAGIYNLGLLHLRLGKDTASIRWFEQALELDPDLHAAARRLAWIYATSEDTELRDATRARRLLDKHYDLSNSEAATVWDTDGAIRAAMGDFQGAIQSARKALAIAQTRDEPDELPVVALKHRIEAYQTEQPWQGGTKS